MVDKYNTASSKDVKDRPELCSIEIILALNIFFGVLAIQLWVDIIFKFVGG